MDPVGKYLVSRAVTGPWEFEGEPRGGYSGAVIIPSLGEPDLPATLDSLTENPADVLARFLVLVVVNNRADATEEDKEINRNTLELLGAAARGMAPGISDMSPLNVAFIDAASPGRELPLKNGGVGLARKIGMDSALTRLDPAGPAILVCLDGDTLTEPGYLDVLLRHFEDPAAPGGAVVPYRHQPGRTPDEERAIVRYELFLRAYTLGLALAGSPYAFHTIGSAMACRARAYAAMGGMNRRKAGEDFYFLQQMAKTAGVAEVAGTMVYPSARPSHRVPFGTGRSVARQLDGDPEAVLFYHGECYSILKAWLAIARESTTDQANAIMARARAVSSHLEEFLQKQRFVRVWERLRRNHPREKALLKAFHEWFDGLKTMKLIHHLSAAPLPRTKPENVLPQLLEWAGLESASTMKKHLDILRVFQSR